MAISRKYEKESYKPHIGYVEFEKSSFLQAISSLFPPSLLPDKVCPQANGSPATMIGIYAEDFSMQTAFAWISYRSFTFELNILTWKSQY